MSENEIRVLYVQPGKYPEERTIQRFRTGGKAAFPVYFHSHEDCRITFCG